MEEAGTQTAEATTPRPGEIIIGKEREEMPKRTLRFKKQVCSKCRNADKRAMRKGWDYCSISNPKIRTGHCVSFEADNPKLVKVSYKINSKEKR